MSLAESLPNGGLEHSSPVVKHRVVLKFGGTSIGRKAVIPIAQPAELIVLIGKFPQQLARIIQYKTHMSQSIECIANNDGNLDRVCWRTTLLSFAQPEVVDPRPMGLLIGGCLAKFSQSMSYKVLSQVLQSLQSGSRGCQTRFDEIRCHHIGYPSRSHFRD